MRRLLFGACLLSLSSGLRASDLEEPDGLLERIQARMREAVKRQPDYTCLQTVDRWVRATPKGSLERMDTLRLEVGLVGNREVFAWKDADRFEERALAAIVNKGTIGNGDFFIHAKNVFLSNTAGYAFKGQYDNGGRKTYIYEYGIPIERSLYRIRVPPHEGIVGYSGTFEVDAVTLDLLRLEVIVDEIPEKLGLAEASAKIAYARVPIGDGDFLLPKASELTMLSVQGEESRNEISFSGCRQFKVESGLVVGDSAPTNPMPPGMTALTLPPRAILDLELSDDLNLESAAIGDRVHTILRHPVREGRRVIVPEGASVSGRLVRVDRNPVPFDHF